MGKFFKIKLVLIFLICMLWLKTGTMLAQQNLPNQELVNNIEIMETVLDKLIAPEQGQLHYFGSTNTKGYYLINYGVIFNVSYSLFNRGIIALDLSKRLKLMENKFIYVDQQEDEVSEDFEKEIEKLKKAIIKFLRSWTTTLTDLTPEEKVTVIVDFNGVFPGFSEAFDFSTHQLIASVPIHEISDYRKGTMSEKEFIDKIKFDEIKSVDEDISILSDVIETSLGHSDKKMRIGLSGNVKGIYFNGYGVIFFTDVTVGTKTFTIYSDAIRKGKERSISITTPSDESERYEKSVEKIEQKLIHLISNYGHNLRNLKPNEWIEIAINFKGLPVKDDYNKSILRVQKKNVDDFNKERIKFDQFKRLVNVIYY